MNRLTDNRKRMMGIVLCAVLLVQLLVVLDGANWISLADPINYVYVDENGNKHDVDASNATIVTSKDTEWYGNTDGTMHYYIVKGDMEISHSVVVRGNVGLILTDGCWLDINKKIDPRDPVGETKGPAIEVSSRIEDAEYGENKLTIYSQNTDNKAAGTIRAFGTAFAAGIGGSINYEGHNITIVSGNVKVYAGHGAAAIGGGYKQSGHDITILGGNVWAESELGVPLIGVHSGYSEYGAAIGGGAGSNEIQTGKGYDITISGGTVYATVKAGGAAIGGGQCCVGYNINVTGGVVTAVSGYQNNAIGGGRDAEKYNQDSCGNMTFSDLMHMRLGKREQEANIMTIPTGGDVQSIFNMKDQTEAKYNYVHLDKYIPVETSAYTGEFDGHAHSATITPSIDGVTVEYSVDNCNWSTTNITRTDATDGEMKVYYRLSKTGYVTTTGETSIRIEPKELTVSGTQIKDSKKYDGTTDAEVTAVGTLSGMLAADEGKVNIDTVTATYSDANFGLDKEVTLKYTLKGERASNYEVVDVKTMANIVKRSVKVTSASDTWEYDGKYHEARNTETKGDGWINTEGLDITFTQRIIDLGEIDNEFTYTAKEGTNLDNYNITTEFGKLKITARQETFVVTAKSASKKYDGLPLADDDYTYEGELISGDRLVAEVVGSITNAGTTSNEIVNCTIMRGDTIVTQNYGNITLKKGTLRVDKLDVTVESASDSKKYDGKPLTCSTLYVTGDDFVAGEGFSYTITAAITDPGTIDNVFDITPLGTTKLDNYNITKKYGKLTVTGDKTTVYVAPEEKKQEIKYITKYITKSSNENEETSPWMYIAIGLGILAVVAIISAITKRKDK